MARIVLDDDSDLDEYVRRYLEDCVQRQVRAILEHQLKNVVAGELARLKLLDPLNPVGVDRCVTDAFLKLVETRLDALLPARIGIALKKHYQSLSVNAHV